MTEAASRPPSFLQPPPKAAPTSSSSAVAATATTGPQASRESVNTREPAIDHPIRSLHTSDEATAALIRRVLCPETQTSEDGETAIPIPEILPSLTSSNEVDLQLYAIIATMINEFVCSWYAKFTSDRLLIGELVRLIAHCTRALEGRLRHVDLEELFFDEIPELVERHVFAYRTAHEQSLPPPLQRGRHEVYHTLCPHPALSPIPNRMVPSTVIEQRRNEAAYFRLIAQGILAVLLPPEELENACLRTLITNIFGEVILGKGIGRIACESWFIWGGITKTAETVRTRLALKITGEEILNDTWSRLEKLGLLSTNEESDAEKAAQISVIPLCISNIFWRILQYGYLAFIAMRFITLGLYAATSRPSRSSTSANPSIQSSDPSATVKHGEATTLESSRGSKRPIITMRIWSLASHLADLADRMPWLTGSLSFLQYQLLAGVGHVGVTDGLLDRFLSQTLTTHFLDPSTVIPPLLLALRTTLFPNNTLPSRPPPQPPPPAATSNHSSSTRDSPVSSSSSSSSATSFIHDTFPSSSSLPDIPTSTPTAPTAFPSSAQQSTPPPIPTSSVPSPSPSPSQSPSPPPSSPHPAPHLSPPPLDPHKLFEIKTCSSTAIYNLLALLLPRSILQTLFNPPKSPHATPTRQIEERVLDLFGDEYLNRHLLFSVLECVVVRVVPEMGMGMGMGMGDGGWGWGMGDGMAEEWGEKGANLGRSE